jgi:hypothetical protein
MDGGIYDGPCGKLHGSGREVANPRSTDEGLQIGRRIEAKRIAATLLKLGGSATDARAMSLQEWRRADGISRGLATEAKKTPSIETRALVIEYLSRPEDSPRDEDVPG